MPDVIRLKMLQTDVADKHAAPRRFRRRAICFSVLTIFTAVCLFAVYRHQNLGAPSVSLTTDTEVTWNHLKTERWGYTLNHDVRVAYFGFWPHGGVGATMGTRDGDIESVTAIGYKWRIETPSRLVFTDQDGTAVYYTFDLDDLSARTATMNDVTSSETLHFTRNYYFQDDG